MDAPKEGPWITSAPELLGSGWTKTRLDSKSAPVWDLQSTTANIGETIASWTEGNSLVVRVYR